MNSQNGHSKRITIGVKIETDAATDKPTKFTCTCGWFYVPVATEEGIIKLVGHMMKHGQHIGHLMTMDQLGRSGMLREQPSTIIIPGR